jgi:fatty acid desaturase
MGLMRQDGIPHSVTARDPQIGAQSVGRTAEWRTVLVIAACYSAWLAAGFLYPAAPMLSILLLALPIVLHSSLQHEAMHFHPTRNAGLNEALVWLPLGLLIPYRRYRDLHMQHHIDRNITDPYDDPESFYLEAADFHRLPHALKTVLAWNNRLSGRIVLGPAISSLTFLTREARLLVRSSGPDAGSVRQAWLIHGLGVLAVWSIAQFGFGMPIYAYLCAVYLAMSVLALRGFCEHRWAEAADDRTVIVERSRLAFLFLNNSLHLVHHKHPGLPWYALPAAYRARRDEWHALNHDYVFRNYRAVIRAYALRAKEQVTHPRAGPSV